MLFRQTYWSSAHRVYSPVNVPPYLPGALPAKAHHLLPVRNSTEVVVVTWFDLYHDLPSDEADANMTFSGTRLMYAMTFSGMGLIYTMTLWLSVGWGWCMLWLSMGWGWFIPWRSMGWSWYIPWLVLYYYIFLESVRRDITTASVELRTRSKARFLPVAHLVNMDCRWTCLSCYAGRLSAEMICSVGTHSPRESDK